MTATNGAGPTALDTASISVQAGFALGKPTIDKKKGIAKLPVATSGSGVVDLGGRFLKPKTLGAPGPISGTIVVKAKGKALKRLKAKGKAKVMTQLAFTPTNGSPLLATKSITLRLKH